MNDQDTVTNDDPQTEPDNQEEGMFEQEDTY